MVNDYRIYNTIVKMVLSLQKDLNFASGRGFRRAAACEPR